MAKTILADRHGERKQSAASGSELEEKPLRPRNEL